MTKIKQSPPDLLKFLKGLKETWKDLARCSKDEWNKDVYAGKADVIGDILVILTANENHKREVVKHAQTKAKYWHILFGVILGYLSSGLMFWSIGLLG